MTAKLNIKDPNTREYWELAVRKPDEYGLNTKQAHAMMESLVLTDPKYWEKVLANPEAHGFTAEQAKYLAKEHTKTLAEHIDEQNQMTPEERLEAEAGAHIGFYGDKHVQMWLEMADISTTNAALLFYGENPSTFKGYDLGGLFNDMKMLFEDVARDGAVRNLRDWIAVARQQNLHAVCIGGWQACATVCTQYQPRKVAPEMHSGASDRASAETATVPADRKTSETLMLEAKVMAAMDFVWNDSMINRARNKALKEPTKGEMHAAVFNKLSLEGVRGKNKRLTLQMVCDKAKTWKKPVAMKLPLSPSVAPKQRHVFKGEE